MILPGPACAQLTQPWPGSGKHRIVDDRGKIVPGASIEVFYDRSWGTPLTKLTSDSRGEFQIVKNVILQGGWYWFNISKEGYEKTSWPIERDNLLAGNFIVLVRRPGNIDPEPDAAPLFSFPFRLQTLGGTPVAGAKITITFPITLGTAFGIAQETISDAGGNFVLRSPYRDIAATIRIEKDGFVTNEQKGKWYYLSLNTTAASIILLRRDAILYRMQLRDFDTGENLTEAMLFITKFCYDAEGKRFVAAEKYQNPWNNGLPITVEVSRPSLHAEFRECYFRGSTALFQGDNCREQDIDYNRDPDGSDIRYLTLSARSDDTGVYGHVFLKDKDTPLVIQNAWVSFWRRRFDGKLVDEGEVRTGSSKWNYRRQIRKAGNYSIMFTGRGYASIRFDDIIFPPAKNIPQLIDARQLNVALAPSRPGAESEEVPDLSSYGK